ncbi:hypothetical protein QAD02_012915 [Eretmocerus hayati]|uniref:Uncharacterized protein n=1 Tax=Eretmocerus hayati TaxID=131215 RepID=A0ACC2P1Z1_9HYME|nr:hypothetical protein QAD02_012915 [Eretmocerus hayati]
MGEGIVRVELCTMGGKWNIWSVYNSGDENFWKIWEDLDYLGEGRLIIGRDFNIRTGQEDFQVDEEDTIRRSTIRRQSMQQRREENGQFNWSEGVENFEWKDNRGWKRGLYVHRGKGEHCHRLYCGQ